MIENVNEQVDVFLEEELCSIRAEIDAEKRTNRISNLTGLYKARVEAENVRVSEDTAFKKSNTDLQVAQVEADNSKRDRIVTGIVKGAEIVIPLVVQGVALKRVMRFEETGKACSDSFRAIWGKIWRK